MSRNKIKVFVAVFAFFVTACSIEVPDRPARIESSLSMGSGEDAAPAANKKLKIVNQSDYDVNVKYKDKDGVEQEVRVRAGSSGSVSDFGGGTIDYSPANLVEGTRNDNDPAQTVITFKNKPGAGSGSDAGVGIDSGGGGGSGSDAGSP